MAQLGRGGGCLHVLLGFTQCLVVTADDCTVKFHELRLSRHRVDVVGGAPFICLPVDGLEYPLPESCLIVLCPSEPSKPCSKATELFAVVSFAPASSAQQQLDSDDSEAAEQCLRPATIFVFRGHQLLVKHPFFTLSIIPEHHALFGSLACFNNGASLEWFQVQPDTDSEDGSRALPCELLGVLAVSMQESNYLTVAPTNEQVAGTTTTHYSFSGALFCPCLIRFAYPDLQEPSVADSEVRLLGPCSTPNYHLVVVGLSLLYRGGGKDLGALMALDTNPGGKGFGNAHVLRWVDLRKLSFPQQSTASDRSVSWLSQATTGWCHAMRHFDPRLRNLHARTQALSNHSMETDGSLRSILHPFLPILVVHDEEED